MSEPETRTKERYVKSYAVRRAFHDAIRHASRARMAGLLYKTLDASRAPMARREEIRDSLERWCTLFSDAGEPQFLNSRRARAEEDTDAAYRC